MTSRGSGRMKKGILNKADVELLVNSFYSKVRENETLGYIFEEVAEINWEAHLPQMYAFWSSILLGEKSFVGNPMQKHYALSRLTDMTDVEFTEWLKLFTITVDELFEGRKAEEAKDRAGNIARLMLYNIQRMEGGSI